MARVLLMRGGGGSFTDFVTATKSEILEPYVGSNIEGEPIIGEMPDNGTVNYTLDTTNTTYTIPLGYHDGNGQVNIIIQSKTETPGSDEKIVRPDNGKVLNEVIIDAVQTQTKNVVPNIVAQTVTPDVGKYLSSVSVSAIPNQKSDKGNVTLSINSTTKSYAGGYYPNAHGATISAQSKTVTPDLTSVTVNPDSGRVLSSVKVNAIPNQKTDKGNVKLTSTTTTKSYAAGYYSNAHGAYVDVYNGEVS